MKILELKFNGKIENVRVGAWICYNVLPRKKESAKPRQVCSLLLCLSMSYDASSAQTNLYGVQLEYQDHKGGPWKRAPWEIVSLKEDKLVLKRKDGGETRIFDV